MQKKDDGLMKQSDIDTSEKNQRKRRKRNGKHKKRQTIRRNHLPKMKFTLNRPKNLSTDTETIQPETGEKQEIPQKSDSSKKPKKPKNAQSEIQAVNGDTASKNFAVDDRRKPT
ncbi:MAG: hypothetical protein L6V93_20040 [Clostridiales bacterium]|nr:MAG: hypothetical protein L6V93_20040 [Clostridiales bacterium]